jgi:hypothetical protein
MSEAKNSSGICMRTPIIRPILNIGLGAMLLIMVGCSSDVQHLQLTSTDKVALKRIYEGSGWLFRESRLDLKVKDQGAIEVAIEGVATRKTEGGGDSLWLPVVFLKDLPSYYRVTEASTHAPVELQAYQVPGGLWCIAAVASIGAATNPSTSQQQMGPPSSTPLKLSILLVAPPFSSGLPLLVTTGQDPRNIDTSVSLPSRAKFTSLLVSGRSNDFVKKTDLTALPLSLTGGTASGAALLGPDWGEAINFSQISYRFETPWYFVPVSIRFVIFVLYAFILAILSLYTFNRLRFFGYARRRPRSSENWERFLHSSDVDELERKHARKQYLINLGRRDRWFRSSRFEISRTYVLLMLVLPILFLVMFVLVQWVFGQPQVQLNQGNTLAKNADKFTALGELGMHVESKDANKVGLTLDFFPLTTEIAENGTEEIGIGVGDGTPAEIEEINVKQSDKVKITQQSRKKARLSVPANATKAIKLLKALSDLKINNFQLPESYSDALNDNNLVRVEYVVSGAQRVFEKTSGGRFYWFPFDTKVLEVPLEFQQPVIISRIDLPEPTDFIGTPSVNGLDVTFEETDGRYQYTQAGLSRLTVPANQRVTLQAQYHRSWFQKLFLTIGQLLIAVIAGVVLGKLAALPDNKPAELIIGAVGIVGGPWALRATVLSTYKDLPTIFSGQRTTLFEFVFIIGFFIFMYFAWRTFKKTRAARG